MVNVVGTFGRSGVHDYILLRASALIILGYVLYFVGFITFFDITYAAWVNFFSLMLTKIFSLFTLIAILIHSWIGIWQVLTDYVKYTTLRAALQFALTSVAFIYVLSGFIILWGV